MVRPGTIAAGQNVGVLPSRAPTAAFAPVPLKLVGRGQGPGGAIEVEATTPLVFAQQSILPTNAVVQRGLPAAPALPTPVVFEAPADPIDVAHGFAASISIKAIRTKGADGAVAVDASAARGYCGARGHDRRESNSGNDLSEHRA